MLNLKRFLVTTILAAILLSLPLSASAFKFNVEVDRGEEEGVTAERDTLDVLKDVTEGTGLRTFDETRGTGNENAAGVNGILGVIEQMINIVKWALGGLAVIFLFYTAFRLLTATDEADDVYTNAKKQFLYITIGLFVAFAADIFITNVFNVSDGNFLGSVEEARQAARIGSSEIKGIYNLAEIFLGVAAVLMIIYHGFRLVSNMGSEEVIDKAKRNISWGVAGLVLVGVSEVVVKDILFIDGGQKFDINRAKQLIVQLTNFASGFIATIAVVMFIYAGYLYIFSGVGEDQTDKVKKTIIGAIIGIILAGGAFAIVNTLVEFEEPELPGVIRESVESGLSSN